MNNREHSGLVTGRTYTATRPRGNAPWSPTQDTLDLIERVRGIYAEYGFGLTVRQYFYRLIGKFHYEKTEQSYKRLIEHLGRARRAGLLPWDAVRDDDDLVPNEPGWSGPAAVWDVVLATAECYVRRPQGETYIEIWVEAAGMRPQIQAVANPFGVRVTAGGGFNSITARRNAALRLMKFEETRGTQVLLIGDCDPSGASIMDVAAADVGAFGSVATFERLALTEAQAHERGLPSAPQKEQDKRGEHMAETWQAEALDPADLAEIVRARLVVLVGEDTLATAQRQTQRERAKILRDLSRLRQGRG